MNRERIFFFGALGTLLVAGCFTLHQPPANEPVYQDRRLSDWMKEFDVPIQPHGEAIAADAVRHIGVEALPLIIDYMSTARMEQFKRVANEWRDRQQHAVYQVPRPKCPRDEALAAVDALGPVAVEALPALEKLLHEDPPDGRALYVAARLGPVGMPLLTAYLTNTNKLLRMEASVCLDMMNSHSDVLYPHISVGPNAPGFKSRICQFNLKILQAAVKVYQVEHSDPPFSQPELDGLPPPITPK